MKNWLENSLGPSETLLLLAKLCTTTYCCHCTSTSSSIKSIEPPILYRTNYSYQSMEPNEEKQKIGGVTGLLERKQKGNCNNYASAGRSSAGRCTLTLPEHRHVGIHGAAEKTETSLEAPRDAFTSIISLQSLLQRGTSALACGKGPSSRYRGRCCSG